MPEMENCCLDSKYSCLYIHSEHGIAVHIPISVGMVSGAKKPDQWRNAALWDRVLKTDRIMISTRQVFPDALRHGYISLGRAGRR